MPEQLLQAIQARQWYPVAAIVLWYAIALWKKHGQSRLGPKIPEGWKWIVPVLLAAAIGFTDGFFAGLQWQAAAWRAGYAILALALPAMGWQGALKESPIGGPPGKFSLLVLLAIGLGGAPACADAKVIARGANDVARDLCALHYAEKESLSLDDAARTFCRDLRPWLDLVLRAQRDGAAQACERPEAP